MASGRQSVFGGASGDASSGRYYPLPRYNDTPRAWSEKMSLKSKLKKDRPPWFCECVCRGGLRPGGGKKIDNVLRWHTYAQCALQHSRAQMGRAQIPDPA
jgi:hypothetical protein